MPYINKNEYEQLVHERDYFKLRFLELDKQWHRVIHKLLGENYYNYGSDWESCDRFSADDLIYRYGKRWWQFWRKI